MASGVPVVGVRAGGVTGIIQHGVTGFMSAPAVGNNSSEFAGYVGQLVQNETLRKRMGSEARKYAESLCWDIANEKLRSIQYPTAIAIHQSKLSTGVFVHRNDTVENEIITNMERISASFDKTLQ